MRLRSISKQSTSSREERRNHLLKRQQRSSLPLDVQQLFDNYLIDLQGTSIENVSKSLTGMIEYILDLWRDKNHGQRHAVNDYLLESNILNILCSITQTFRLEYISVSCLHILNDLACNSLDSAKAIISHPIMNEVVILLTTTENLKIPTSLLIGNLSCETQELRDILHSRHLAPILFNMILSHFETGTFYSKSSTHPIFAFSRLAKDIRRRPLSRFDVFSDSLSELIASEEIEQAILTDEGEQNAIPPSLLVDVESTSSQLILSMPNSAIAPDDREFAELYTDLLADLEERAFIEKDARRIHTPQELEDFVVLCLRENMEVSPSDKDRLASIVSARHVATQAIPHFIHILSKVIDDREETTNMLIADCLNFLDNATFRNRRGIKAYLAMKGHASIPRLLNSDADFIVLETAGVLRNVLSCGEEGLAAVMPTSILPFLFKAFIHPSPRVQLSSAIAISQLVCASPTHLQKLYDDAYLQQLTEKFDSRTLRVKHEVMVSIFNLTHHSYTTNLATLFFMTGFHTVVLNAFKTINDFSVLPTILNTILSINTLHSTVLRQAIVAPPVGRDLDLFSLFPQTNPLLSELLDGQGNDILLKLSSSLNETIKNLTKQILTQLQDIIHNSHALTFV
ncbi:hypothetical protein BLNAU_1685 [Blattamonas nauphoetae]|uniref:Uncharacterized protein n=1 Tax=Blattamonas nauphoetae TaxID=2049346 RepID=A0ABQ9YHC1_9EUKA|nr:hypothetical protein BLNAU_1685 [Blattamonas nauphoetae]